MKRLYVPILLLVFLAAVAWRFTAGAHPPHLAAGAQQNAVAKNAEASHVLSSAIVVHHTSHKTADIYSGSLPLLSSCDTMQVSPIVKDLNPVHVELAFQLTTHQDGCRGSASSTLPFSISILLPKATSTPIFDGVTVNGIAASSTLVED
ncbi:MAG: hypothetical protein KGH79_04460 [Patescibacteria group bacterium]|nr:hypothetical protein [Patescibacteria group bacterium]